MKKIPIGISDFKTVIEEDFIYIDKTLLIDELWRSSAEVILMPRPRRFGKTLNLSMLHYFFEKSEQPKAYLFHKTAIWQQQKYHDIQGTFPVIYLSFKEVKSNSWPLAYNHIALVIASEFQRHSYLLEQERVSSFEKERFRRTLDAKASEAELGDSLKFLCHLLHRHYEHKVIVLIDEYDTPIHAAHSNKYYLQAVDFIKTLLGSVLKDNPLLKRGFLTGILRTAKEGIFSGLNNLDIFSFLSNTACDKFGFTPQEVTVLLDEKKLQNQAGQIKEWYNSYRCGTVHLYNPWSLLNCVDKHGVIKSYWVNTSDNAIIKELIASADSIVKSELEKLLNGEAVIKQIDEAFVYSDIKKDSGILWSLLFFTGYVTYTTYDIIDGKNVCSLVIPNKEIHVLFEDLIQGIFKESLSEPKILPMLRALTAGDVETFSMFLQEFIMENMSVYDIIDDEAERSYHNFVLGLLVYLKGEYEVKSNGESGYGRYDIMLLPHDTSKPGVVIEFKKSRSVQDTTLEKAADKALEQIEKKKYVQILRSKGIKPIFCYGVAVKKKNIFVKMEQAS